MEAAFLSANHRLPLRRFLMNPSFHRRNGLVVNAKQGENDGKFTDENLIVLKMRIKKMKALESKSNQGTNPRKPEKDLFVQDHGDGTEEIELLRTYFMNNRQSVILGMLGLIALAIPLSASPIMMNALKVVKGLLAGSHVCIDIDF